MANLRRTSRNGPKSPRGNLADHSKLSQCKLCPAGVYADEPHVWLRKPAGWSHTGCAQRAGLAEADTTCDT